MGEAEIPHLRPTVGVDDDVRGLEVAVDHPVLVRGRHALRGLLEEKRQRPRVVRPTTSNAYCEMDLTYVWCGSGFGYLFAVIDAYDKGIQCPDDKPYIESFFGHYKTEEVYRSSYTTLAEAQVGWQLYRIWYETERVHESLHYQTPKQRMVTNRTAPAAPAIECPA